LLGGNALPVPAISTPPRCSPTFVRDALLTSEEISGPVASIIPVADEAAAIATANDTLYGLGAAIFTKNRRRALTIARQLDTGMVFVNGHVRSSLTSPSAAPSKAATVATSAPWGLRAFVNPKTVWIE